LDKDRKSLLWLAGFGAATLIGVVVLSRKISRGTLLGDLGVIRSGWSDKKTTANQMAKQIIADRVESAEFWNETYTQSFEDMTQRERDKVDGAVEKQQERVYKFLGVR